MRLDHITAMACQLQYNYNSQAMVIPRAIDVVGNFTALAKQRPLNPSMNSIDLKCVGFLRNLNISNSIPDILFNSSEYSRRNEKAGTILSTLIHQCDSFELDVNISEIFFSIPKNQAQIRTYAMNLFQLGETATSMTPEK